ncbi:MAG: Zn-ribbon containing protein [Candidatus Woesearchaeota archaeon]
MPNQCVRCGKIFEDVGIELIYNGCECGGKLFFYIKKENLNKLKTQMKNLSTEQKSEMIKDVYDIIGQKADEDEPVILDLESINVQKPGSYEIDLVSIFSKKPLIYKLGEGKYVIDLVESFKNLKKDDHNKSKKRK